MLMKTEIPKEINLKNIEDIIKKAEVDLNTIKLQITKGNDKENCKTNKTKLLELRRKKKEAENLLFNEKITKEQYNNLLEILKAIQIEEKDLEEKSKFSLSHQDFNDFNYVNGPLANLETIILTFKENFSNLILETKLLRKKLKQVKLEKKASEDENNCNFTKLESFYQIEFSKILQKIEDIEVVIKYIIFILFLVISLKIRMIKTRVKVRK